MTTKIKWWLAVSTLLAIIVAGTAYWWRNDAPRRESLASLTVFEAALHSGNSEELLPLVVIPTALRERSSAQQYEFLAKALNNEISQAGLAALRREATFGPLREVFPAEAERWAAQAGVFPEHCVAFKAERSGLRTEVVLLQPSPFSPQPASRRNPYRIIRLNNVKQLASLNTNSKEQQP